MTTVRKLEAVEPGEPEGRRARKRRMTRTAILESASALFSAHGVEKTSMDSIAERADISIASLYNYFPSKDLLLSAIIEDGMDSFIAGIDPIFEERFASAIDGYMRLIEAYFAWFDSLDRLWLRRFAAHALSRMDLAGARYSRIEEVVSIQVHRMTGALRSQGLLQSTEEDRLVSKLVWSLCNSEFFVYVANDGHTAAQSCSALRRMLALALQAVVATGRRKPAARKAAPDAAERIARLDRK